MDHPQAQDSLKGLTEWWLLEHFIQMRSAEVKTALDELVADGLVVVKERPGVRPRFGVNRERSAEIRELLGNRAAVR